MWGRGQHSTTVLNRLSLLPSDSGTSLAETMRSVCKNWLWLCEKNSHLINYAVPIGFEVTSKVPQSLLFHLLCQASTRVSHIRFFKLFASKRIEANPILIRFQFASFSEYSLQNIHFDSLWFASKYLLQDTANVQILHHKKEQNSKKKLCFIPFVNYITKKNFK